MVIVKIIIFIAIIIMKNMTGQFVIHCLQCKTEKFLHPFSNDTLIN